LRKAKSTTKDIFAIFTGKVPSVIKNEGASMIDFICVSYTSLGKFRSFYINLKESKSVLKVLYNNSNSFNVFVENPVLLYFTEIKEVIEKL